MGWPSSERIRFLFRADQGRVDRDVWRRAALGLLAFIAPFIGVGLLLAPYTEHDLAKSPLFVPMTALAYAYLIFFAFVAMLVAISFVNLSAKRFRDHWSSSAARPRELAAPRGFSRRRGALAATADRRSHAALAGLPVRRGRDYRGGLDALPIGIRAGAGKMTALSPAVELTRELLRCPSVTPEDAGALDVLERALNAAGFACARKIFHEAGTPDVDNLFARIGEGAPHLVFAGHTDVVPPGDMGRWRFDPFSGEVAEGRIFGRGASDMKGAIAAFAAAALEYLRRHGVPKGAISFLITGDEEGPSINGTVKLLDWARERGERFDHCIVGEPTNVDALGDMMKIGRRGSLNGQFSRAASRGMSLIPSARIIRCRRSRASPPRFRGTNSTPERSISRPPISRSRRSTSAIPRPM